MAFDTQKIAVTKGYLDAIADGFRASRGIAYKLTLPEMAVLAAVTIQPIQPDEPDEPITPEIPAVPQTGTWQMKESTGKKYIIIGTDDDNPGNAKFFRLLRTYGFPYTMNVEAENAETNRKLGSDVDDEIFTAADAPSLFPDSVGVVELGKYLHTSGLGEVAQHGASTSTLWDSAKLTGDFLTEIHASYVEQGGTKTAEELRSALMEAIADSDVQQGAPYVSRCRDKLGQLYGFPITTVGIWGGAPTAEIDGITIDLNRIKGGDYNWRAHNYQAASTSLSAYAANSSPYDIHRIAGSISAVDAVSPGKVVEMFWHFPLGDAGADSLRQLFRYIKTLVDAGKAAVVTRQQYAALGEYVANPVVKITASRADLVVGEDDSKTAYTVTATYQDGTTADVSADSYIGMDAINTAEQGVYVVPVEYRGINTTVSVVVSAAGGNDGQKSVNLNLVYTNYLNHLNGRYTYERFAAFATNPAVPYDSRRDYFVSYSGVTTNNNTLPAMQYLVCYDDNNSYLGYIELGCAGVVSDVQLPRADETYPNVAFIAIAGGVNKLYGEEQTTGWSCYSVPR